ncbi:BTB/POZ domain-containing protein [Ditylenchus destructor]|nr:BTB/POZ domain-containing protein [Ditylenchus destructor]
MFGSPTASSFGVLPSTTSNLFQPVGGSGPLFAPLFGGRAEQARNSQPTFGSQPPVLFGSAQQCSNASTPTFGSQPPVAIGNTQQASSSLVSSQKPQHSFKMSDPENDYTNLVIVAEDTFHIRKQGKTTVCVYNTLWDIREKTNALGLDYTIDKIFCQSFLSDKETSHAETLFISNAAVCSKIRKEFKVGDFAEDNQKFRSSVVIRILEDKQTILEQFDARSAADVTFLVNGEECKGDRKNLAVVSPVFNNMLFGNFEEAHQDKIELESVESVEIFKDFLLAVSPLRIQPNPSNVVALLKLAHQYDIPFLMRDCEEHLVHCYEIPILDRILLAGKYKLDGLKVRITQQMSADDLKKLFKEKRQQLRELDSDFILYLASL